MGVNDRDRGAVLYVRIPKQHKQHLQEVADGMGLKLSDMARFAIQHYLYGTDVPGAAVLADGDDGTQEASDG